MAIPTNDDPARLRLRARELRRLAAAIERTPAMSLDHDAGPETWRMPRAELCLALLRSNQQQLHVHAEELRWLAHRLECRAVELETSLPGASTAWGAARGGSW